MAELVLNIVTPKGTYGPVSCDSIHLTVCDNTRGKGGGSYGIRPGHMESLLTLDEGTVKAFLSGKQILEGKSGCGFATVANNTVTVVAETYSEEEKE